MLMISWEWFLFFNQEKMVFFSLHISEWFERTWKSSIKVGTVILIESIFTFWLHVQKRHLLYIEIGCLPQTTVTPLWQAPNLCNLGQFRMTTAAVQDANEIFHLLLRTRHHALVVRRLEVFVQKIWIYQTNRKTNEKFTAKGFWDIPNNIPIVANILTEHSPFEMSSYPNSWKQMPSLSIWGLTLLHLRFDTGLLEGRCFSYSSQLLFHASQHTQKPQKTSRFPMRMNNCKQWNQNTLQNYKCTRLRNYIHLQMQ